MREHIAHHLPEEFQNEVLISLIYERISKYSDVDTMVESGEFDFLREIGEYDKEKLLYKDVAIEKIKENLKIAEKVLTNLPEEQFDVENIKNNLMLVAEQLASRGELLHPVRFALSGRDSSPDPFTIASILGKDETIKRIQKALQ